jgi:hypothetical protein
MVADSRSSERLAQLDFKSSLDSTSSTLFLLLAFTSSSAEIDYESVGEVGTTRLSFQHAFPSACNHKLFNGSRLEGLKCNPNFQGLASNMFFLLLMVTSSSMEVGLKAQNATQISMAPPDITCNTFKAKIL